MDVATIESALAAIPPDCERPVWVRMGMAVKSELGDDGFHFWDAWSQTGASYNARDARDVWKSIRPGGGIGIATLFHIAKANGWKPDNSYRPPSQEEREARRRRQEAEAERERRRIARRHGAVAKRAAELWQSAEPVIGARRHAYLAKKGVRAHGIRLAKQWERRIRGEDGQWHSLWLQGVLLIPMIDGAGRLWNLQSLFGEPHPVLNRDREFLAGGKTAGLFHLIESPTAEPNESGDDPLLIAEGYATAAALFEATGYPTFNAFSAGNLEAVAHHVRTGHPRAQIVLCADHDPTGLAAAHRAARAVHGAVATPPIDGADFCDWRQALNRQNPHG